MATPQELYGRKGRIVTDQDAKDITRVEELAYDLKVSEVMTTSLNSVTPEMPMVTVLDVLRQHRISGLPVVEDLESKKLAGIVSLEDMIRAMCANDIQAPISNYMTSNVISLKPHEPVVEAMEVFIKRGVGRLPVIDDTGTLLGMITKGDITRGVLIALQKDYQEEEVRRYRASHLFEDVVSDRTTLVLRYHIKARDFTQGGVASANIKRALMRMGANPQVSRRCGIAVYEAEMNLVIHTNNGGIIKVEIEPHRILMHAIDDGPGIADKELALRAGWSTAPESVRELGFGAGMGLPNIQRCVDKMILESSPEKGTKLEMKIYLEEDESFRETGSARGETKA